MTTKKPLKAALTRPKSGAGKAYDRDLGDQFFRGEHPDKPEPKVKGRVLTSVELEFWSGLTS